MLLAALTLSLHGLLSSLVMAAPLPSPQLAHLDCHGHAGARSIEAAPETAGDQGPIDHVHGIADAGAAAEVPSPRVDDHKHACCTPAGVAVLPQLPGAGRGDVLVSDQLMPAASQIPAGHTPDGLRKPPRTSDQV